MRLPVVLIGLLLALPVSAGEKTPLAKLLDSMEISASERETFDAAARKMYDPGCNCIRFIVKGQPGVTTWKLPLNDGDRVLFKAGIYHNLLLPIKTVGPSH